MAAPEARALSDPPTDGITSLCYLPQSSINPSLSLLACSSWDGCLRVYDTKTQANVVTHSMDSRSAAPLLSLAVPPSPEGILVAGSLNGLGKSIFCLLVKMPDSFIWLRVFSLLL